MPTAKCRMAGWTVCVAGLLSLITLFSGPAHSVEVLPIEPFDPSDRVLIISPHPDDDILCCAGVIQRALRAGAKVKVVYMTCGDNNIFSLIFYADLPRIIAGNKILYLTDLILRRQERFAELGRLRKQEAIRGQRVLGMDEKDLVFLGYPDHGTDQMFILSWDHLKPYHESLGGHSSVPYEREAGYGKEYTADNIVEDLKVIIKDFRPDKIFVPHSSDMNGDHWASYMYLMAALSDVGASMPAPKIYPYLVHVQDWPLPRHYNPQLYIGPPEKFFGDAVELNGWRQLKLTPEEIAKKRDALARHESQMRVSSFYLLAFVRQNEIFGDFPAIKLKMQNSSEPSDKDYFTDDMRWIGYAAVDESLWIRVGQPEDYDRGMEVYFFITGFRDDTRFADMPNIMVSAVNNKLRIWNATEDKNIYSEYAYFEVSEDALIFKIPLDILGNPQRLLVGIDSDADYMPQGYATFRMISIE